MFNIIFTAFYIFLPAGIGNVTPIIVGKISFLKKYSYPVDFYKTYKGKRILGDHKTVRGFITGTLMGISTAYCLLFFYTSVQKFLIIDFTTFNIFWYGLLSGFGALFGDSLKSFFKRQLNIKSGEKWFPFDQLDYVFGGILFMSLVVKLPFVVMTAIFFLWFGIHILSTSAGYLLGFKDEPI